MTTKETIEHIVSMLGSKRFTAKAMFGEYALYCDGVVVALVCDDQLYVKILPTSAALEKSCEKDTPYPGAKEHYVVEESTLHELVDLPDILVSIAKLRKTVSVKNAKKKKSATKK